MSIAGAFCLVQRVDPLYVPLHDLRAVDQTLSTEGNHVGLAVAPFAQRSRPLVGAAQVKGLLTHKDHRAVGPSGHMGETSSVVTATIASSSSGNPRRGDPSRRELCPRRAGQE